MLRHRSGTIVSLVRDQRVNSRFGIDLLENVAHMFSPHGENSGMTQASGGGQQSVFSRWLRTGRLPRASIPDGVELKFNPWHDPTDGRFTFVGSGDYHGPGRGGREHLPKPRVATGPKSETLRTGQPTRSSNEVAGRGATGARSRQTTALRLRNQSNTAAEFVGGVGEGLYGVARGTVAAAHSALTTSPVTTVRNVGRRIAGTIDTVVAAEDTPAAVQVSRAANAVANASAREIGRATGSVVGNAAIAAAPGAALGKVAALRSLREAALRPTFDPPQIGWVKENLGRDTAAKRYNDAATGARPGQAPTLMRTMPDGSKRPVKFDGVQSEYVIDRKFRIVTAPRARAQLLRQSDVLAQHRLIGTWEVPNEAERIAARKLLKEMNVTNIRVRVVKP